MVIRNHLGDFMAAAAGPITRPTSAIHTEFMAARQAVLLVQHCWSEDCQITFEGDVSLGMAAMKGQGDDSSPLRPIVNDLRCFLAGMPNSRVSHVQREGNEAAHRLAWMGLSSPQEFVWFEEPPDLI
ncbi:uncharacterized protein LOC125468693 [Pyrus x bretschneideri]|uniref:uncharacterized protein LOC125468693 n=1 Tax=Pyrus x bretschneideri TaxID=225117 RepID=UPI00202EF180|nr:uncharacterized protein LOC125468693 [Pyrus x bretschneideri]